MPRPPTGHLKVDLTEDPIDLTEEERVATELTIEMEFHGDGTQTTRVFRICCYNSRRKPSQLHPRFFRALPGLETISDSVLCRLRTRANTFAESEIAAETLPVIPMFTDRYRVKFVPNPRYLRRVAATPEHPVPADRFVTLSSLVHLERLEKDGGHLLERAHLIVQGRTPLLIRPEVATIVLDNMGKGVRYQFVFPRDAVREIALALAMLLDVETNDAEQLKRNMNKIGSCLEIYLSSRVWPFVISVHNANHDGNAKTYLRVPDSDCLLELYRGGQAHRIAEEIRSSVLEDGNGSGEPSWIRSQVDESFRTTLLSDILERLHLGGDREIKSELVGRLFGRPRSGQ